MIEDLPNLKSVELLTNRNTDVMGLLNSLAEVSGRWICHSLELFQVPPSANEPVNRCLAGRWLSMPSWASWAALFYWLGDGATGEF